MYRPIVHIPVVSGPLVDTTLMSTHLVDTPLMPTPLPQNVPLLWTEDSVSVILYCCPPGECSDGKPWFLSS